MKLKDKIQHGLDESRMLVLGLQVLLGFDFQAFLMRRFETLPESAQKLKLVTLALLLITAVLLFAPAARHRIVERGEDTAGLHRFTRHAMSLALFPFALGFGGDVYVVIATATTPTIGLVFGVLTTLSAIAAWYVVPRAVRRRAEDEMEKSEQKEKKEKPQLNEKIRHVLTEARVVLPGTQALLGFQLAGVLQEGFDRLPASSKHVHLVALGCLAASVVLLMLPAAFHRVAEKGEITERLHRFTSACILAGMVTLAVALAADAFVVVRKDIGSVAIAVVASSIWLAFALFVWIGLMLLLRYFFSRSQQTTWLGSQPPSESLA
jgi:hypothetical protein